MAKVSIKTAFSLVLFFLSFIALSQETIQFSVSAGDYNREYCPVYVNLSKANHLPNKTVLCLYQNINSKLLEINFQIDETGEGIWFIPKGDFPENTTRNYILKTCDKKVMKSMTPMKLIKPGSR